MRPASFARTGVGLAVAESAAELQVVELVRSAVGEWDAVMHLEVLGAAAADAGAVAGAHLGP